MAPKAAQDRAKKKAAKQKKLLIILAVPMIGALVFAYTTMSGLGGKKITAAPVSASTPAGSVPTAADTTGAGITPGIPAVQIVPLHSFSGLGRKDPFHNHGPNLADGGTCGCSSGPPPDVHCRQAVASNASGTDAVAVVECKKGNGKWALDKGKGGSTTPPPKQPTTPLTGAVISLNGKKLALAIGTEFGQAPGLSGVKLFRLINAYPKTALIGVVGTKQQFRLHVGRPLKLHQTGGWTYTLVLQPLGSAAPMTVQPTPPINDAGH